MASANCILALIEFTDNVKHFLDEGNYVLRIFVDLAKAFDTVDHEILVYDIDMVFAYRPMISSEPTLPIDFHIR